MSSAQRASIAAPMPLAKIVTARNILVRWGTVVRFMMPSSRKKSHQIPKKG